MEFKILAILCLAITFTISEATQHEGHQEVVDNFEFDRGVSFLAVRGGNIISKVSRLKRLSVFKVAQRVVMRGRFCKALQKYFKCFNIIRNTTVFTGL